MKKQIMPVFKRLDKSAWAMWSLAGIARGTEICSVTWLIEA